MPRVVVVGSINVDLVVVSERLPAAGETVAGGRFASYGGGKSANQAVAAARLGADVVFVGAVGRDAMGDEAEAELRAEGIDVSGLARLDEPTGVALIVVDAAGENQIAVASGANAAFELESLELDGDGVVLLGHEVSEGVVIAAARAAEAAGWPVVLNPAPARELPAAPLAVLTPNASEAEQLTGESDPEAAARALSKATGAAVLITLGARGALLLEPGGSPALLPATKVDVVDTTGAGDTVNGALAAELAAGRPLREAAEFALRAAAISTTKPGARGGMPTREEVDATA
ncbi:ribokinase [Solirubrobacter taibaiensis]|nr:ribokinase [Solirubrobacter taibaiensis]